ncbi:FAD binding domain protein [Nemania abortiva]|nr:FAD binding domain protein [Nemania abortiva]
MLYRNILAVTLQGATLVSAVAAIDRPTLDEGATCACEQLAATFDDAVIMADSADYEKESLNFWDIRAVLQPKCIVLPEDPSQVSTAVSILISCGAQFAIRGGGHMNFPGSNNINGGVLLALNHLKDIHVAADNKTVDVGPGTTWADVYGALDAYDLYCIGGRLKNIGVPGLSLIGGFHYMINKYGMVMDNIVDYDVVLGNGTQVVANSTSNPDLFWALKGGANNLGIVTKFTLKTFPISQISTTIQVFNESVIRDFLAATVDLANDRNLEVGAGPIITITYNTTTKEVDAVLRGVQEGTESPPSSFRNFSAIPSVVAQNAVMRPIEWHNSLDSPFQMFRVQFAHKTMKPDTEQLLRIYQLWKQSVEGLSDVEGLIPTLVLNLLPASALTVGKTNGVGNVWGLDDDQSLIIWQFSTGWDKAESDLRMTNWAKNLLDFLHAENQEKGLASEFLYMGDSGEFQDPFLGYAKENVARLRAVREQYDPSGTFSVLNWGGFKLPSV